ncbi:MAG: FadR family transcriptional regulator [Anaerolineales bacterium]|nr:FadR family transcriptional regulator [Anaerolineales bacterium]
MTMQPFQRVSTARVSEAIVEQIRQAIIDGQFQPGDRLPSQRDLAKTFGVGRSALLEAIRILEQSGLLTIRTGGSGGAFVTAPSIRQVSDSLDLLFRREGATREELSEFRIVLESYCCKMAAEKASDEELANIEKQFQELKALADKGSAYWQTFLTREIEFHFLVANLSHNRVSMAVLHSLATWLHSFSSQMPELYKERMLKDWEAIVTALRNRDGENAQHLLSEHIYFFNLMHTTSE